jgi:isopenicillin-N epimerase
VPSLSWGRLLPGRPECWSDELLWSGTRDPSAYLTIPAAIDFLEAVGLDLFRARTHALARVARTTIAAMFGTTPGTPDSEQWYGSMGHIPLPPGDAAELQGRLWREFGIEVPIVEWRRQRFIRVSCHLYNDMADLEKLFQALHVLLR